MKYCQECGSEMFDDATLCPNCGTYQTVLTKGGEASDNILEEPMRQIDQPVFPSQQDQSLQYPTETRQNNGYQNNGYQNNGYQGSAYSYDGNYDNGQMFNTPGGGAAYPVPQYSFWKYFLLGLITCGIYSIYCMYKWTEDTNRLSQGIYKPSMNYIGVFLLSIVTCGIYYYVWVYQQGERLKAVGDANGIRVNESGVHHLLLSLLLGGIGGLVSQYIFFNNTNRLSGVYNGDITRDQANAKHSHTGAIIAGVVIAIIALIGGVAGTAIAFRAAENHYSEIYPDFDFEDPDFDFEDFMNSGYLEDYENYENYASEMLFLDDGTYIEIGNAMVVKDINGDPALAVEFYWENAGDETTSAMWKFDITAEQSGRSLATTWPVTGDPDIDLNNYTYKIEPGEIMTFQMMFKLANNDDNVSVTVKELLSSNNEKAVCVFGIN